ncbi:MAG: GNAT family N-acetyltransferase [candidate division Zixibacteria bacterium]|nr:GNAT family N-acetyltransferase [candidate division Zixibacteria bacterium]
MNKEHNKSRVRFLEGERIFLTPLSLDDVEEQHAMDNDLELQYLDAAPLRPKAYAAIKAEVEQAMTSKTAMFLSVIHKETGKNMGNVVLFQIHDYERTAHWGIKLLRPYWRQGFGREAASLLLKYAFEDLGLVRLESGAHAGNTASVEFQKSLGCVQEGHQRKKLFLRGQYVDFLLFGMLKEDYDNSCGRHNEATVV